MRHAATRARWSATDVIIVASVSCIYGIGFGRDLPAMTFALKKGERIDHAIDRRLVALQSSAPRPISPAEPFGCRGDTIDIFRRLTRTAAWRVKMFGDEVEAIEEFDPLTDPRADELEFIKIYANSHYVTPRPTLFQAIKSIKPN